MELDYKSNALPTTPSRPLESESLRLKCTILVCVKDSSFFSATINFHKFGCVFVRDCREAQLNPSTALFMPGCPVNV